MKRSLLVGVVGLALAGCAQLLPTADPEPGLSRLPPVSLTPVPNVYEALNQENTRYNPAIFRPERGPVLASLGAPPGDSRATGVNPSPNPSPRPGPGAAPGAAPCAECASAM